MTSGHKGAIAVLVGFLSAACSAQPFYASCAIGETCKLEGKAVVFPPADGQQAWLELPSGCVALALPDNATPQLLDGHHVQVIGTEYEQPEGKYLFYDIKGRRISAGICEGKPVLFVDKVLSVQ